MARSDQSPENKFQALLAAVLTGQRATVDRVLAENPFTFGEYFQLPGMFQSLPAPTKQRLATVYGKNPDVVPAAAQPYVERALKGIKPLEEPVPRLLAKNAPDPRLRPMGVAISKGPIPPGNIVGAPLGGESTRRIDPRLVEILTAAAHDFNLPVVVSSGYRPGDPRQHGRGRAIDVQIIGADGKPIPNYQNAATFRVYEQFAQLARQKQQELHPDLANGFRWGGYFSGGKGKYGAVDLMHFDLGGLSGLGMLGGSWDMGLTADQRRLIPGAISVGMNDVDTMRLAALGYEGPGSVERYQAEHGLKPDGIIGPLTQASIADPANAATAIAATFPAQHLPTTALAYGAVEPTATATPPAGTPDAIARLTAGGKQTKAQIRESQQALADAGFNPGPIDGIIGPRTRAAQAAFSVSQSQEDRLTRSGNAPEQPLTVLEDMIKNGAAPDALAAEVARQISLTKGYKGANPDISSMSMEEIMRLPNMSAAAIDAEVKRRTAATQEGWIKLLDLPNKSMAEIMSINGLPASAIQAEVNRRTSEARAGYIERLDLPSKSMAEIMKIPGLRAPEIQAEIDRRVAEGDASAKQYTKLIKTGMEGSPELASNKRPTAPIPNLRPRPDLSGALARVFTQGGRIRKGITGDDIKEVQKFLNQKGVTDARGRPLKTDGIVGIRTRQAIKAYQETKPDLRADGVIGPRTLIQMLADNQQTPTITGMEGSPELAANKIGQLATTVAANVVNINGNPFRITSPVADHAAQAGADLAYSTAKYDAPLAYADQAYFGTGSSLKLSNFEIPSPEGGPKRYDTAAMAAATELAAPREAATRASTSGVLGSLVQTGQSIYSATAAYARALREASVANAVEQDTGGGHGQGSSFVPPQPIYVPTSGGGNPQPVENGGHGGGHGVPPPTPAPTPSPGHGGGHGGGGGGGGGGGHGGGHSPVELYAANRLFGGL